MGYKEMDVVWEQSQASKTDKLVLLAIARRYNPGVGAWPSQQFLAEICGIDTRSVRASISRLHKLGELSWIVGSSKSGKSNTYFIRVIEEKALSGGAKTSGESAKTSAISAKTSAILSKNFRPLSNTLNTLNKYIYSDVEFDLSPGSEFWQAMLEVKTGLGLSSDQVRDCLARFQVHPNYRATQDRRVQAKRFLTVWLPNEVKGIPQERQGYSITEGEDA